MSEDEWNSCRNPDKLLDFLWEAGKADDRKLRLFGAACCRPLWTLLTDSTWRRGVQLAEVFADARPGGPAAQEVVTALRKAGADWEQSVYDPPGFAQRCAAWAAVMTDPGTKRDELRAAQCGLLRDLFGPASFRELNVEESWLSWEQGLVPRLARSAYDRRELPSGHLEPDRLAVLASALEEAGAGDSEIFRHLKTDGPHVRGCVAIDLLLGRG